MRIELVATDRQGGKTNWIKDKLRDIMIEKLVPESFDYPMRRVLVVTPLAHQTKELVKEYGPTRLIIATSIKSGQLAVRGSSISHILIDEYTYENASDLRDLLYAALPAMYNEPTPQIYLAGDAHETLQRLMVDNDEAQKLRTRVRELEQAFEDIQRIGRQIGIGR